MGEFHQLGLFESMAWQYCVHIEIAVQSVSMWPSSVFHPYYTAHQ